MATRRVIHTFRDGDVKEVKEYHDGRYGAKGLQREKKRKPTQEQMAIVNAMNKAETARHTLDGMPIKHSEKFFVLME